MLNEIMGNTKVISGKLIFKSCSIEGLWSAMAKVLHSKFVTFLVLAFHFLCYPTCVPHLVPHFVVFQIFISWLAYLLITQSHSTNKERYSNFQLNCKWHLFVKTNLILWKTPFHKVGLVSL